MNRKGMPYQLTDNDLDIIAERVAIKVPNKPIFTPKTLVGLIVVVLTAVLIPVFSSGMVWNKISQLPKITEKDWSISIKKQNSHSSLLIDLSKDNIKQDSEINRLKEITGTLKGHIGEMKGDIGEMKEILIRIDEKIKEK